MSAKENLRTSLEINQDESKIKLYLECVEDFKYFCSWINKSGKARNIKIILAGTDTDRMDIILKPLKWLEYEEMVEYSTLLDVQQHMYTYIVCEIGISPERWRNGVMKTLLSCSEKQRLKPGRRRKLIKNNLVIYI